MARNTPVDERSKRLRKPTGPFTPSADISSGIARKADGNDTLTTPPWAATPPEATPVQPDRQRARKARRRAISRSIRDDDSGKAWLE